MDDLFDLDLYFNPQSMQKPRGSAEQSTAALIASSMNSEYTEDWSHRQHQAHNHLVQAPSLVQLAPGSYTPTSNHVMGDSISSSSANVNGVGSFDLSDELSLPPMRAPTDNINFIPQFSNVINYSNLEEIGADGDQSKDNGAVTFGNNESISYGSDGVLGPPVCHELQSIDGPTDNTFMGIPISSKKDYEEETPYYTDLDIFKPIEEAPKNSDGRFLSPSIELNNQYSPSDQSSVGDPTSSKKKSKSPRKTPIKKKKGATSENPPGSHKANTDPIMIDEYSGFVEVPKYDGNFSFPNSHNESNNLAFQQYPKKPESTNMIRGKVKTPRKTPTKKSKAANYKTPIDSTSLKIKLKCEKSIGTENNNENWSVSGDNLERLNNSPAANAATLTANNSSIQVTNENLDRIHPTDTPESISRVGENKTEHIPTPKNRNQSESKPKAASEVSNLPSAYPVKEKRPPSTSKTKCPTAKAPSYLTGFPMRCPEYPIVYCCNHCARIFTSIRGGQLHECVKKRPGRKAGVKSQ